MQSKKARSDAGFFVGAAAARAFARQSPPDRMPDPVERGKQS
ncbi:hypothetical protein QZM18_16540 [Burkholderia diffusa]|jgi:hypothetical protein|nr:MULTISPECIES: hypothetical protein [Burkholderia]MDN7905707.1 hypothetical protein [Burkholderia diffusa]